jgi:hypothetical protein
LHLITYCLQDLYPLPKLHVNDVRNGNIKFKYKHGYPY